MSESPWPIELKLDSAKTTLTVTFDNGQRFDLAAEYLRVESPSAEVQGHSPDEKQIVTGKEAVTITALDPVGNYAVRISFDDGHNTGLYSWDYLYGLGCEHDAKWSAYMAASRRR